MEYRANFIIGASSTIVVQASSILAIWVVMQKVPNLNGWRYDEILLVYGLITLAKSRMLVSLGLPTFTGS